MAKPGTKKKLPVVPAAPTTATDLLRYNTTELLHIARDLGQFDLHRGTPKKELVSRILNPRASTPYRPVDRNRIGIMQYVIAHYEQVRPLVAGCPASYQKPTSCFTCSDLQVTDCWEVNGTTFRPVTEAEMEKIMAEKQTYEPRSRDEWTAIANSGNNTERALVAKALMQLGFKASDLNGMDAAARVDKLMELQAAHGFGEEKKPAKTAAKTAAKPAAAAASASAQAARPAAAAPAGGSPGNEKILERLDDLQDRIDSLAAENAELKAFIVEMHAMTRATYVMGGFGDELMAEFKGKLVDPGNE